MSDVDYSEIPLVCRLADLARILKRSTRTIARQRRARAFQIPELEADARIPTWSKADVIEYLERHQSASRVRRSA